MDKKTDGFKAKDKRIRELEGAVESAIEEIQIWFRIGLSEKIEKKDWEEYKAKDSTMQRIEQILKGS